MPASRARYWKNRATTQLAWFHRWLGISTCLIFALWFASGAVLLFEPFPSLSHAMQLELQRDIDFGAVRVPPRQALAVAGGEATSLRLVQRGAAPAWLVGENDRLIAVDAKSGAVLAPLSADQVVATQGVGAVVNGPFDYDQWVVHNHFDPLRPLYRLDLGDAAGTQLYVSARSGEPVQRTTRLERGWNWVGAVLHWIYFTPLRSSFTAWDRSVWVLSLVCLLVAVAGTILGVIRTLAAQRQRRPSLSFYRLKWMRWHHILGLFASLFVLAWTLSGWLSMDHGRLFSRGEPSAAELAAYQGASRSSAYASFDPATLRRLGPVRALDFSVLAGQPLITVHGAGGQVINLAPDGSVLDRESLLSRVRSALTAGWPDAPLRELRSVAPTETYALAEGWPGSTLLARLSGAHAPSIAVDGEDGHILTVMSGSRASYAWIYYALHTFNFPFLTTHPLLRDVAVLVPLLFGFLFSLTGVVIGVQRLGKVRIFARPKEIPR